MNPSIRRQHNRFNMHSFILLLSCLVLPHNLAVAALKRDFSPNATNTSPGDLPAIVHLESSASGLDNSPSSTPSSTSQSLFNAPHLESSATALTPNGPESIVPPIPHLESSVPADPELTTMPTSPMQMGPDLTATVPCFGCSSNIAISVPGPAQLPTSLIPAIPAAAGNSGPSDPIITNPPSPVLTVGSEVYTANSATQFVVGSQTLQPGGPAITISGTTLSLAPSATAIVVNGATSSLNLPTAGGGGNEVIATTLAPVLTIDGTTYTANSASGFVIAPGTTLTPGGVITVSGTVISLEPSGSALVFGKSTSAVQAVTTVITITTPEVSESGTLITSGSSTMQTTAAPFSVGGQGGAKPTSKSATAGRGTVTVGWVGWIEWWLVGFAVLA